jgi:hypothetical protein
MAKGLNQGWLGRTCTVPFIGDMSNAHYSLVETTEGALEKTRGTMKYIAIIMVLNDDVEIQARFIQLVEYRSDGGFV